MVSLWTVNRTPLCGVHERHRRKIGEWRTTGDSEGLGTCLSSGTVEDSLGNFWVADPYNRVIKRVGVDSTVTVLIHGVKSSSLLILRVHLRSQVCLPYQG